jgi:hypothetical protein
LSVENIAEDCGSKCDQRGDCDAIYSSETQGVCWLISGNYTDLCDPSAPGAGVPESVNGEEACEGHGFTEAECLAVGNKCCHWNPETGPGGQCWSDIGKSVCYAGSRPCSPLSVDKSQISAADCGDCQLRVKDRYSEFCGGNADECASAREYWYCMQKHGCASTQDDATAHRDICLAGGCSAKQCGLSAANFNPTRTLNCINEYYYCVGNSEAHVRPTLMRVSGAGSAEINGEYVLVDPEQEFGSPPQTDGGGLVGPLVWQQTHNTDIFILHVYGSWWIGHRNDGTADYYIIDEGDSTKPPVTGKGHDTWTTLEQQDGEDYQIESHHAGTAPAPTVVLYPQPVLADAPSIADVTAELMSSECYLNYQKQRSLGHHGAEYCGLPWAGGIDGCHYHADTDTCSASSLQDCECTRQYIECLKEDYCEPEQETFEEVCLRDRCSPEQCGIEMSPAFCEIAGPQCIEEFATCENSRVHAYRDSLEVVAEADADHVREHDCGGFCLRGYFHCIDSAGCAANDDVVEQRDLCLHNGCNAEECGFSKSEEQAEAPPNPLDAMLVSLPDARFHVQWRQSDKAIEWARKASKNRVAQYMVDIEGDCTVEAMPKCGYHVQSLNLSAKVREFEAPVLDRHLEAFDYDGHPINAYMSNRTSTTALTISQVYKLSVYAMNRFGMSPEPGAWTARRLAGKPGAPQAPTIEQSNIHTVSIEWERPENTGDGTDAFDITGYRLFVTHDINAVWPLLPNDYPNMFDFEQEIKNVEYKTAVGGSFEKCADVGQTCYCQGIVRLGFGNLWSPPFKSHDSVECEFGDVFPNVVPSAAQICQCNSMAIPILKRKQNAQLGRSAFALSSGRVVRSCVAAYNRLRLGLRPTL